MEQLNKQQIILLALLVSFVSSIATGIVVVSITEQGSRPTITQTINRVVERTIERVVPTEGEAQNVVTETVIVRDDQAVVAAIDSASRAVVRIFRADGERGEIFVGLGVIASSTGTIVAKIDGQDDAPLSARLHGGNSVTVARVSYDPVRGLSILQAEQSDDPLDARAYSAATFADSNSAKLGQSAVLIGGEEDARVAVGIVSSLEGDRIQTSVVDPAFDTQAILVNLSGEVLGMRHGNTAEDGFVTSNNIKTYATP